jgi:glycosyltransferase involved in cell wall biosynthesis
MDVGPALAAVRAAPTLLEAMREARVLATVTVGDPGGDTLSVLRSAARTSDPLTAIAAVHALGASGHPSAGRVLAELLAGDRRHVAQHAVDALRHTPLVHSALPVLVRRCQDGGFTGMLAQHTLEQWAKDEPEVVRATLVGALSTSVETGVRARLVETLGLVAGGASTQALLDLAGDDHEALPVRAAALAALGDGPAADRGAEPLLVALTRSVGPLAQTARLALHDLCPAPTVSTPGGLTVAQVFLHSDIDGRLHHSGQGDTGGIATLLVHLGDALLRQQPHIGRVITISGGSPDPAQFPLVRHRSPDWPMPASELLTAGHHYARVPLTGASTGISRAWPARVSARRGIRRVLRAAGHVDAIHLRMADVGSMAAAEVAVDLGIPVVLTLAPDPQALIDARDTAGTLTRSGFGEADLVEHLWFRDRVLLDLTERADQLVLFPRPKVERDLRRYLALDLSTHPERATVVGEGVDVSAIDRTVREVRDEAGRGLATSAALRAVDDLLATLPADRRSLPVAVSVGRLNAVKGMATLVRAWADDADLHDRCNLLLVGGDLEHPTDEEAAELARIDAVVPRHEAARRGLLLAGHRPNATTIAWLAALQQRRAGTGAPPGIYVSASLKEEFGIAILEAMAVGLVVVAPAGGGPATYVADGETGILTDTSTPYAVAAATHAALDLAVAPGADARAREAQHMVRTRFGIDTMAVSLAEVYQRVAAPHRPGSSGTSGSSSTTEGPTQPDVMEGAS